MSFNKDALELLQRAHSMEIASSNIGAINPLMPLVTVPDGFSLTNLEQSMPGRGVRMAPRF